MCLPAFLSPREMQPGGPALGNGHTLPVPIPSLRTWWGQVFGDGVL